MKAKILISVFLLVSILLEAKKIEGYYIDPDGNKVEAVLKISMTFFGEPKFPKIQKEINFIENGEVRRLTPGMCKKFGFSHYGVNHIFHSLPDNYFLKLKNQGPVSIYYFYYYTTSTSMGANGMMSSSSTMQQGWKLYKDDGQSLTITYGSARKGDLLYFFSDCKELTGKIERKEIRKKETERIVREYNAWRKLEDEKVEGTVVDSVGGNSSF